MPTSVLSYAAQSPKDELAPYRFERRDARPDDVVIDILYCGVCHSDLHTARNDWGWSRYPVVPGHEIIGRVLEVGASVTRFKGGRSRRASAVWSIPAAIVRLASTALSSIAWKAPPSPTAESTATMGRSRKAVIPRRSSSRNASC